MKSKGRSAVYWVVLIAVVVWVYWFVLSNMDTGTAQAAGNQSTAQITEQRVGRVTGTVVGRLYGKVGRVNLYSLLVRRNGVDYTCSVSQSTWRSVPIGATYTGLCREW